MVFFLAILVKLLTQICLVASLFSNGSCILFEGRLVSAVLHMLYDFVLVITMWKFVLMKCQGISLQQIRLAGPTSAKYV